MNRQIEMQGLTTQVKPALNNQESETIARKYETTAHLKRHF